jgi:hypothetical protein
MLLLNFKAYFFKSLGCTVVIIHHDGSKTERNFVFNSVANMGRSVELRGGVQNLCFTINDFTILARIWCPLDRSSLNVYVV